MISIVCFSLDKCCLKTLDYMFNVHARSLVEFLSENVFPQHLHICNPSPDNQIPGSMIKPDQVPTMPHTVIETCLPQITTPTQSTNAVSLGSVFAAKEESKETLPGQLAVQLTSVAMEGLTDEELSDSGGEGMYRERDEFVVRNEDIDNLKVQP